jgi:hypothetical protein
MVGPPPISDEPILLQCGLVLVADRGAGAVVFLVVVNRELRFMGGRLSDNL